MNSFSHSPSLTACLLFALFGVPLMSPLHASTGAGELLITGKGDIHYTAAILFNEYFSGPREFMPGQPYRSSRADHPGPFRKGFSVTYIDGRMVKHEVMLNALLPGRRAYVYESRGQIEFLYLYTHELPVQGHLLRVEGNQVNVRRYMTRRDDTGTPVFRIFAATLEADADYYLDGDPSTRDTVLAPDPGNRKVLRVFPAQKQTISAFRPGSLAELAEFGETHTGAKTGMILKSGRMTFEKRNGKTEKLDSITLNVKKEGALNEEVMPIDRKGYMVLDGRYIPWRHQALRARGFATGATYRGGNRAKYMLVRSALLDAWEGEITAISPGELVVKRMRDNVRVTVPAAQDGQILVDGLPSSFRDLTVGMSVTVFNERPQVVEAMTGCFQTQDPVKRYTKGVEMMIVEYGLDGKRRVIKQGQAPFWQDKSSGYFNDFEKAAGSRYPESLRQYGREEAKTRAMALTPDDGPFYYIIPEFPPVPFTRANRLPGSGE